MRKEDLNFILHQAKDNSQVVVHLENDCYYPIIEVTEEDGFIILKCKDVKKVEE